MTGNIATRRKQFDELIKPIDRQLLTRRAINVLAVIGGIFAVISTLSGLWPDSNHTDPTPGNSSVPASTLVTGFAREYVTTYLTAKAGDEHKLARYVTLKDVKLPPVAGQFTDADVAFAKQITTTGDGVALWTVTISGLVNGAATTAPQRTFYRVPITVLDGAPRATALPMQVASPGIGVDFRLGYGYTVATDSPLGMTAAGFVRSYLTGGADFARYVTADSDTKPIQPAPYANVDILTIEANVGGNGSAATTAEVYINVAARTKNYTLTQLAYPLSLRSVEGQWQVVSIAAIPVLRTQPDNPHQGDATTTTSTTPPPPPTRG
ncbi:conjugal transfer protein [Mycobacterium simiae]|uniref:Conjugal transfer protein n=1 Tax=Mycobacterium simiae TaxID=1784 RepID=A0A5B1BRL1_MYCSI|nr:conjugal transfer protein [Mycobacterium simiae]KAA1250692.1 conjugal transfer protein [Mycobacterium simiae]